MEKNVRKMKQINKVLVANRGEIAVRIFETLHQMGITTVAIYSANDANALHVRQADERYLLQGKSLAETYLDMGQIIRLAQACEADAIHPGYGFLAENADFAQAVDDAGIIFIGPSAGAIRSMGNKTLAREIAADLGIPVIEGATGDAAMLLKGARRIGYPVIVKATGGGGGKGMKIVHKDDELEEVIESATREAQAYFGNPEVYIEKYLPSPRHIEVQLLADCKGQVVSLFERECSVQRRHQKIIEEAPAPNLGVSLRKNLTESARILAKHIGYCSAGTVEFLVQGKQFYFLEMNTRIQVEHPVTEMVTGIDIVKEQMHIATGKPLPFSQGDIQLNGHAIEARVYAEDPANEFAPSPGKVLLHQIPKGKGLRIDSSLDGSGEISAMFDPMVSKVIFHSSRRETARKMIIHHLKDYVLLGIKTNISYLIKLLNSSQFTNGKIDTTIVTRVAHTGSAKTKTCHHTKDLLSLAFLFANPGRKENANVTWRQLGFWRLLPAANLKVNGQEVNTRFQYHTPDHLSIDCNGEQINYRLLERGENHMRIDVDGSIQTMYYLPVNGEVIFQHEGVTSTVSPVRYLGKDTLRELNENPVLEGETIVTSPMHGTIVKVVAKKGDHINKGDTLLILESMKMENKIISSAKAYVTRVDVKEGDMVADNTPLVYLSNKLT